MLILGMRRTLCPTGKYCCYPLGVGWAKRFLTFLLGTPQVGILSQHVELTAE